MTRHHTLSLQVGLALASLILAVEPLRWLFETWRDPARQSDGLWFMAVLAALMVVSLMSGPAASSRRVEGLVPLFLLAAALRLAGQLMAVNIIGALSLAIDVYALALLLRVDRRPLTLSPLWLSVFFLFAMPLAPIIERVLGFPLQVISADLSCRMLGLFFSDLTCEGTRLVVSGVDVLVDLPCSGAAGLLLMGALWTVLNALFRPRLRTAALCLIAVLASALIGNALRISLLAGGLALGFDTMAPGPHQAIGLATLLASAAPFLFFYRPRPAPLRDVQLKFQLPRALHAPAVVAALSLSLAITAIPRHALDRSGPVAAVDLPAQLLGQRGDITPLTDFEKQYFIAYGGAAQKAQYGPLGLNVVRTGAPLRHLHAPATCLLGLGFQVTFLGTRHEPVPTAVYEAKAPDGSLWHVAVTYTSAEGHRTASVGEAVWSWLSGTSSEWQSVQRITPVSMPPAARAEYEHAALAALDL